MSFDTALAGSGIAAASVSADVASALFDGATPLAEAQKALDTGNPHVAGFELPGITVSAERTSSARRRRPGTSSPTFPRLSAHGSRETVGRRWRALRSSRPRRARQFARIGCRDWAGRIWAPTTTPQVRRRRFPLSKRCRSSPDPVTCWSHSGQRKKWGWSARARLQRRRRCRSQTLPHT